MTDSSAHSHDRLDDATIARYLGGTCEPAELARVERWLAADPAHRAELAALRAVWIQPPVPEADPDDRMWRWIAARMDEPLSRPTVVRPGPARHSYLRRIGAVAAALVALAGGALLLRLPQQAPRAGMTASNASVAMREVVTPRRTRATTNLPDGSLVILGPDSRLQIPRSFVTVGGARDVYLQGEAFFEVTHDSLRPFRVHTASGIVEDLGTKFVVTAYPETGATRAVVMSGIVALRGSGTAAAAAVVLHAGDLGRIDAAGATTVARNIAVAPYVDWIDGNLVFDEVPLQDAVMTLSRWYDLDIRIADTALARRRFTAAFHDEPVSQVLRTLEVALGVRVERRGQSALLLPRDAPTSPHR